MPATLGDVVSYTSRTNTVAQELMTTRSPISKKNKNTLLEINPMAVCVLNAQARSDLASSNAFGLMLQPIMSRWSFLTDEERAGLEKLGFSEFDKPDEKEEEKASPSSHEA